MILLTREGGKVRWKLTEVEERVFGGDLGVVLCKSSVVKMKEHLPFREEFSILCIENRAVVVVRVV